jgi:hypothetical protein
MQYIYIKYIAMTNEEIMEEIYYEAHYLGLIDELHLAVKTLHFEQPRLTQYEKVDIAYSRLKKNQKNGV